MEKDWAEFFWTFMKFEAAMKMGVLGQVNRWGTYEPAWRAYIANPPNLPDDPKLAEAIHYLTFTPPRVQVDKGKWEERAVEVGIVGALEASKTVRNNLFHGGKWGDPDTHDRNGSLVRHALYVLQACAQHDPRIHAYYDK